VNNFHVFHAGVNFRSYPFKEINILSNPIENASDDLLENTKRMIKTIKATNVILDSGGNTIFNREQKGKETTCDKAMPIISDKGKINLTPHHVIEIARKLKPTAVVALDNPLQKKKNVLEKEMEFKKKLEINIAWAKETVKMGEKDCPEVSVLVPIQASSFEQMETFLEALSGLKISGVSLPIRNMGPRALVLFLTRLQQLQISWVHVLGTTCFTNMAIAAFFARQGLFEVVSMDAMTWKESAKFSGYLSPHNLCSHKINNETVIEASIENDCNCRYCKNVSFESIKEALYQERMLALCCHNSWVTESVAGELYRNAGTLDQLANFMNHKSPKERKSPEAIDAIYAAEEMKDQNIRKLQLLLE
jgi:tRNA-guanine family transglycosylase